MADEHRTATSPVAVARDGAAVAVVEEVSGDVRWRPAGDAAWRAISAGQELLPSDAVQTMDDGRAVVRFVERGTAATMEADTTLRIPEQAPEVTRLKHLSGRLLARVDGNESPSRLEVELPPGTLVLDAAEGDESASVEAQVEVAEERTQIAMLQGDARLDRNEREPVQIEEAHFLSLANDGEVVDSGRSGSPVELTAPADGASVRTRDQVTFVWSALPEVDGYRLEVVPSAEDGETRTVELETTAGRLPLASGEYRWTARGTIEGVPLPAAEPRRVIVDLDVQPPALTLRSPTAGQTVSGRAVLVAGSTEPGATVEVDGRAIEVGPDGAFEVRHSVPRGLANVVVRVADDLGNARLLSRSVLRR